MNFLANLFAKVITLSLPLLVHEIVAFIKKAQSKVNDEKHEKAIEDLKKAQDEEAIKEAVREIAKKP